MELALDPGAALLLLTAGVLYARAIRVLRRRGWRVPPGQQACWWVGLALQVVALLGPAGALSDELLTAHMVEHILLAELAVPFLLAGLRTPVLVFFLPRPVLVPLAHRHRLRAAFRLLRRPIVAIPVYLVVLYGWHFAFAFEGALRSPLVHVLQHVMFVGASVLVWWGAVEPKRARLPGELWKIPYVFGARLVAIFLGMAFLLTPTPVYESFYGERAREHGLSPLADQQLAGGIMMTVDALIIVTALIFFFWRASQDADRAERSERAAAASA
jgi:cytochrome c oxidase assembly factor CtaG